MIQIILNVTSQKETNNLYIYYMFQIEAKNPDDNKWDFFRICHLNVDKTCELKVGLFANSPIDAGGNIVFHYLKYAETDGYDHKAS